MSLRLRKKAVAQHEINKALHRDNSEFRLKTVNSSAHIPLRLPSFVLSGLHEYITSLLSGPFTFSCRSSGRLITLLRNAEKNKMRAVRADGLKVHRFAGRSRARSKPPSHLSLLKQPYLHSEINLRMQSDARARHLRHCLSGHRFHAHIVFLQIATTLALRCITSSLKSKLSSSSRRLQR